MNFLPVKVDEYVIAHSEDEPELLKELNRETHQKILHPVMLSGAYQGRVLSMISKLIRPNRVLEIGTYTGYATLCLAEGLTQSGEIHTIDNNEELFDFQRKYFDRSVYGQQIIQHLGNAMDILPNLDLKFDLVFIDADKTNYINYFNLVIDQLNSGGVILSDNVLWYGKVVEPIQEKDKSTKILTEYNTVLKNDKRVETVILPIRDGLTISRKL